MRERQLSHFCGSLHNLTKDEGILYLCWEQYLGKLSPLKFRKMWNFPFLINPGLCGSLNLPFYGNHIVKSERLEESSSQAKGKAVGHLFYLYRWYSFEFSWSRKLTFLGICYQGWTLESDQWYWPIGKHSWKPRDHLLLFLILEWLFLSLY